MGASLYRMKRAYFGVLGFYYSHEQNECLQYEETVELVTKIGHEDTPVMEWRHWSWRHGGSRTSSILRGNLFVFFVTCSYRDWAWI